MSEPLSDPGAHDSDWEVVVGLEIHAQLATKSKIFSAASTTYGAEPNTQACAIDLGLPGVLPVLNAAVVTMAVKFGLAVGATIAPNSVFARKNYFYPDLPKGYQISQFELPIVSQGTIQIELPDGNQKTIGITRAHLEEDAGKSLHEEIPNGTGIDLNRAGTPLLEIVSEPEMRSAKEAVAYMRKIHSLVRYLEICDGNMQEGSFRCDANVSIRRWGSQTLGTRTELKNLNSFRFVERAINFEVERQIDVLEEGGSVTQETRLYDSDAHQTRSMRSKEEANDYRYFPDPDLLPVEVSPAFVETVARSLPELPDQKRARFVTEYSLGSYDAALLTASRDLANYFEQTLRKAPGVDPKICANWVSGELLGALNKDGLDISNSPVETERLATLLLRLADGTVSGKIAKQIFSTMWGSDRTADEIIDAQGLRQVTDASEIESLVLEVLANHTAQVEQYRGGAHKLLGFFVGQVMKSSQGRANPQQVNELLRTKLNNGA